MKLAVEQVNELITKADTDPIWADYMFTNYPRLKIHPIG